MKQGMLSKNLHFVYYALAMGFLLVVMQWLELRFLFMTHAFEIYAGAIALIFTALGIWLAKSIAEPKKNEGKGILEPSGIPSANEAKCFSAGISKREMEVLELMAKGCSNAEIASDLFVSVNTVKTHVSNILSKLDVSRRTQAIEKATRIGLLSH